MGQQGYKGDDIIRQGEVLFHEGRLDEAEDYFLRLIPQYPSESKIKNNLGAIKFLQGDVITAKEYFLSALAVNENDEDAFINLKELYRNQGIWREFPQSLMDAETITDLYAKAFKVAQKDPGIHNDIGIIQLKAAQWDIAEKSFLTAISLDPTYQEAFYNLGRVFMHNERYAEAIDNFIAATMLNPENEVAKKAIIEYQNEEIIKRIGKKYKNILIVMEKGVEQMVILTPALKAIKQLHPESHITLVGCVPVINLVQDWKIIDKAITQPDNQSYDIAILTIYSSIFFSYNKTWLLKNCRQIFLPTPLRGQDDSDCYFHIARCLGYSKKSQPIGCIGDRDNNQITVNSKNKLSNIYRKADRVFCISMQRTGTTSVGKFFRDFGYRWAGWPADEKNNWSSSWHEGDYEKIFSSSDFNEANAFEDSPWFLPGFYRVLFHRFPNSKFILFTRDSDQWFASMIKHSGGNIIGKSRNHCKVYRREMEYFRLLHSGVLDETLESQIHSEKTMKLIGHDDHYKEIYQLHNIEVQDFFRRHNSESLHVGKLEDPDKWVKLGRFLDIEVPKGYDSRENVSHG